MYALNLPPFEPKIRKNRTGFDIFDVLRRKYVRLTPEEWVRQHFVNYLSTTKNYPISLMANEIGITLNQMTRRCDTVVYDKNLCPKMIIEYKEPTVTITQPVFDQIVRYNMVLKVDYLIISNGLTHYCCKLDYDTQSAHYLEDIPAYNEL